MRSLSNLLAAAVLAVAPTLSLADPVEIEFIYPLQKKAGHGETPTVPTQPFSGWPLSIELTMNGELGIAASNGSEPPYFPDKGQTGFVLFDDPDQCLVLDWTSGAGNWPIPTGPTCWDDGHLVITESDETYFEFTPDTDEVGVTDAAGNPVRIAALVEATSGRPVINPGGTFPAAIGPFTGAFVPGDGAEDEEIIDGFGYGADDDVPGLVLVARHGPGIVYREDGIATTPLELRNLAGFVNSVRYELNNAKGKTSIIADLAVPSFLIAPVVVADDVVNSPPGTKIILWRVDGAAEAAPASDILGEPVTMTYETGYPKLVGSMVYTISAMAVSGVAPDTVIDLNGDDVIDERDLEQMGYQVLGDAKSIQLRVFPGQACFGGSGQNTVYADLDGNGSAIGGIDCPPGPGSVSKPPR